MAASRVTVSNEPPSNSADAPARFPPFRPRATTLFRLGLGAVFGVALVTGYTVWQYFHSPYWNRVGIAPDQPVLFSHRHHAGELRIDCRFCHATVETSASAGMPTTQTCLNCHSQIFTDTAMLQPVVRSAVDGQPLSWTRVTALPEHVFFNHSIHVAKGVSCVSCHGEVGRMGLTAKARPLDMRDCLSCHRDPAPAIRPREEIFAATQPIDAGRLEKRGDLVSAGEVHSGSLTNCSTCHH